jgi:hypothetical protein
MSRQSRNTAIRIHSSVESDSSNAVSPDVIGAAHITISVERHGRPARRLSVDARRRPARATASILRGSGGARGAQTSSPRSVSRVGRNINCRNRNSLFGSSGCRNGAHAERYDRLYHCVFLAGGPGIHRYSLFGSERRALQASVQQQWHTREPGGMPEWWLLHRHTDLPILGARSAGSREETLCFT